MIRRLFVYGTLGPGRPNEHVLTSIGGTWEEGSVSGYLISRGWGAKLGYSGIVLDDTGDEINGFIFSSDNLDNHWEDLDAFEGNDYERVRVSVKTESSNKVDAYIYRLRSTGPE